MIGFLIQPSRLVAREEVEEPPAGTELPEPMQADGPWRTAPQGHRHRGCAGTTDDNHEETIYNGDGRQPTANARRTRTGRPPRDRQHPRQRQLYRFSRLSNSGAGRYLQSPSIAQSHVNGVSRYLSTGVLTRRSIRTYKPSVNIRNSYSRLAPQTQPLRRAQSLIIAEIADSGVLRSPGSRRGR